MKEINIDTHAFEKYKEIRRGREKFIILFTNNKGCSVSTGKVQKLVNTIHIQYLMDIKVSVYL